MEMDFSVIATYRCNAHCQMCNIWQHPSARADEFEPALLEKLPGGMARLNITGGEPMIRDDIIEIAHILQKKTRRLELSTNGFFTERIVALCKEIPDMTVRVSIEGLPALNDRVRGIKDGFDHAIRTILRLKAMGMRDIGFSMVISDHNCADLLDLYQLCASAGFEFASAVMHNSFYFHKTDNQVSDLAKVEREMQRFIRALLSSRRADLRLRAKDWARAYLSLGLLQHMQGKTRPLPCAAGTDFFFVSPQGEILSCNGSPEPWVMGDLRAHTFEEIWHSRQAEAIRQRVRACTMNCWMTGSAVPAMRRNRWVPLWWVIHNKARLALGKEIEFDEDRLHGHEGSAVEGRSGTSRRSHRPAAGGAA